VSAHPGRGQTRRQRGRSSAHGRSTPRSWADATTARAVFATRSKHTSVVGRRDGRDELRCVATRTTSITRRASPRTCRALREIRAEHHQDATLEASDAHNASEHADAHVGRVRRANAAVECSAHATRKAMHAVAWGERARSPSTSTSWKIEHVSANAPGRTEGSREHTDLAVTRIRDDREGALRHTVEAHPGRGQTPRQRGPSSAYGRSTPRSWADATAVTSSAASRREPPASRVGRLPSDLPDASGSATEASRDPCGASPGRDARGERCTRRVRARDADAHVGRVRRANAAVECSEHATRKAMHAVARGGRARPSNSPSTRRGRPCTRSREASEHGHRAHRPRGRSSTSPRMRPAGPRGAASTPTSRSRAHATIAKALFATRSKHTPDVGRRGDSAGGLRHTVGAPRSWADATTARAVFATRSKHTPVVGRRDGRDELCCVAARTTGITRRASPLGPAGCFGLGDRGFARSVRSITRTRRSRRAMHTTRQSTRRGRPRRSREASECRRRVLGARDAEGHARGRARRARTAVEFSEHATRKAMHAVA
jgi:hypothetical protein